MNILVTTVVLAFFPALAAAGGCGCGCLRPLPPPCPPPPICLPPPPPCPLPPPCPPTFCPPPPICPPLPPPPPPPLPCPPPSPCGGYLPPPSYVAPMPAFNDCCCRCGSPCRFRAMRARTHGSKIFSAMSVEMEDDPTCNSEKLRNIIEENISNDPSVSKRAIQKAAEHRFGAKINVICANSDFSYVAYTEKYCQASFGDVICYAFQPQ